MLKKRTTTKIETLLQKKKHILFARLFFIGGKRKERFQKKNKRKLKWFYSMSSASEIPVMTLTVAVLDQPTAYNGLIHELKQDENQRAIIFGRQNVTGKASVIWSEFS